MKVTKYLLLYRHDGEVFQEFYFSSVYSATRFIEELILNNDYNRDMDELMIQVQEKECNYGEVQL